MNRDDGEIPDDRELDDEERALVRWLVEHGIHEASNYRAQVDEIRVISRCRCGCASLNFCIGERGWPTKGGMKVLSDHDWVSAEGRPMGIFLFAHDGTLAGIDVHSPEGLRSPAELPSPDVLEATLLAREPV